MTNRKHAAVTTLSVLLLLTMGGGIHSGYAAFKAWLLSHQPVVPSPDQTAIAAPPLAPTSFQSPNFVVNAVNTVGKAVVKIEVVQPHTRRFGDRSSRWQAPEDRLSGEQGNGSGFIFRSDGYILTNAHVVRGVQQVTVKLKDGRRLSGTVVGRDQITDVAVIKIDAQNLPTVTLANSQQLQVGEWAIAIGNPLGLENTVTTGIISAIGRSSADLGVSDFQMDLIQTDAAINPGNSGGPLLNAQGQVLGINTAIIQDAQGIGFAIPIHRAKAIADQLIAKGKVDHPYLGIEMVTLTAELQAEINQQSPGFSVPQTEGILVLRVKPNSPAAQADIRAGDIIQTINGQPVTQAQDLQRLMANQTIGNVLKLAITRRENRVQRSVQVGTLPSLDPRSD